MHQNPSAYRWTRFIKHPFYVNSSSLEQLTHTYTQLEKQIAPQIQSGKTSCLTAYIVSILEREFVTIAVFYKYYRKSRREH